MKVQLDKSWIIVIVVLIIFWPVGLILLLRKLATDKSATIRGGGFIKGLSYVLIGLGVIWGISAVTGDSSLFVPAVLTILGGFWLNGIAKNTKARAERYKKYIALIVNQQQSSLDYIATVLNIPYDTVLTDIKKMIEQNYFPGAYIDEAGRMIVRAAPAPVNVQQQGASAPAASKVLSCRSCGANNTVYGGLGECEYCGSPLA